MRRPHGGSNVVPAQFRVIVTHRPKYACRACTDGVVQAPAPERLIKGGLPTEAMVAHVLVAKYAWHLPLYRQAQMLLAQGIDIKRSVLAFWVGYAAAELRPLWLRLRETILTASKIAVDETTAPVLDPGRGRTKKGFFWAISRDDRRGAGRPACSGLHSCARSRRRPRAQAARRVSRHHAMRRLYRLQDHCRHRARRGDHARLLLGSSARRRFFDVVQDGPAPIASEALERIAALYAIEKATRGRSADERRAVRQKRSKPQVEALKIWFEQQLTRVSGKATIAEHIRYALNHWNGLTRFLDDGRIELDNDIVERSIRPLILNRKNALFAGHDEGAENWACIASLIETCKLCGVEPQTYLTDVLTRLVNLWPASRLDELMPWAWIAERANNANGLAA